MDGSVSIDVPSNSESDILPRPSLGMIGTSPPMQALRRLIMRYAPLPAPVLVTGETGTGKELVACALHDASPRATGPFVALNAGAMPATLIASELFGHERGAFTGATNRHRGAFEQAHGGTLFLDEVGELALDLQAWLLRVLETGEVRVLGSERPRRVDVRVVAATNASLEERAAAGRFRRDLYYRLAVLTIAVPALRDRRDDLAPLAEHFLASFTLAEPRRPGPTALQALALHGWPGNVRELRAVLMRAAATSARTTLDAEDIVRAIGPKLTSVPLPSNHPDAIRSALLATRGNVTAAARLLGRPRATVRDAIERLGIGREPN
jgi:DNA-binding NtrC family response regulator